MRIVKGRRNGKNVEIEEVSESSMMLLPPRLDVCQECARDHDPRLPHDKQSLYYQMKHQLEHNRGATWADAMAHCSDEIKAAWIDGLKKFGIEVES